MENVKRKIRVFFATYGNLLFYTISIILFGLYALKTIDNIYAENTSKDIIVNQERASEEKEEEENDKLFISQFLDYCNNKQIQEAYNMLSKECINQKYKTIDTFKIDYVDKIFTYKKEYEIKKQNELYIITIKEGILQSGSANGSKDIVNYYKIKQEILDRKIYIEG